MLLLLVAGVWTATPFLVGAQTSAPSVVDPRLVVNTVISGLSEPISMAFLGSGDFLILERASGLVKRVTNGSVVATVLDLPVNSASERGLLGIALHPNFPANPGVYLFWTKSSTNADSALAADVELLANRVDRYEWNGTTNTLAFDAPIIQLRAFQADAGQPLRANHNGGVLRFGPDGNLYIFIGDVGRRGWMQNLECGPVPDCSGGTVDDDQFGGPEPDNAHLTGVVLRLEDDGSTPGDNPFIIAGTQIGGEAGDNIKKVFAYGFRNSFGMDFDPFSGDLWLEQNGDDSFSELHRVTAGLNGGWIQIMGPVSRIDQYKEIETSPRFFGLQQIRWPPTNIADSPEEALERLFMLRGAHYSDPEFSWKFEVAPAGLGFLNSRALGPQYEGDLFLGGARPFLEGGHLFRFNLTGNRRKIAVDDPRLEDRVADNLDKFEITESESLLFVRNFGVATDIQSGPDGNLYVVSISSGAVYVIRRAR